MNKLFTEYFCSGEQAKENTVSLVNALYGKKFLLEEVDNLYLAKVFSEKQAVITEIDGKLLLFSFHGKEPDKDSALRCLIFVAKECEKMLEKGFSWRHAPEFFVFYHNPEKRAQEKTMCFSDLFYTGSCGTELKVQAINLSTYAGHDVINRCPVLKEFVGHLEKQEA